MPSPQEASSNANRISLTTATSITVANMVGTGVFTSLGFQVADIQTGFPLLLLWVVGGVFALCGALSYGELAAALPRSGGEFHFLSRVFHPALGFMSGWISFTVGFAAPIALAAMAFGRYFGRVFPSISPLTTSCVLVILVTLVHLRDLRLGSLFQNVFTVFKVVLIVVIVGAAIWNGKSTEISFAPAEGDLSVILGAPFAISLLFVMYAYTGWNAATYVTGEMRDPTRNVPRSLFLGTLLVLGLYVALNWAFLISAPIAELEGQIEVGHVAAAKIFGATGGQLMSAMLCIALISTISAMVWAGPRVTLVMGQDFAFFRALAKTNEAGVPRRAIALQSAVVLLLLVTATFEAVLVYVQFTLVLSSFLTVLGVFYLRHREPDLPRPYKTWGYPVTPLLFLAISLVTLAYTLSTRPWESAAGLLTALVALPIYWLSPRIGGSSS